MEIEPQVLQQLLELFDTELAEQLQVITDGLLVLEKDIEPDRRQQLYNDIFRAAHNIKGAARGVEVQTVSSIAHHLESLFSELKRNNRAPSSQTIDLCLQCLDRINEAFNAFKNRQQPAFDITALLQCIDAHSEQLVGNTDNPSVSRSSARQDAAPPNTDTTTGADNQPADTPGANQPPATANTENNSSNSDEIIRITTDKLRMVSASSERLQISKIEMDENLHAAQELSLQLDALCSNWGHTLTTFRNKSELQPADIVLLAERSLDILADLNHLGKRLYKDMRGSTKRLGVLCSTLQSDVRMMRLVPVASLLHPLERVVRDVARELGKKIDFVIHGDEIEMDRAVLDNVQDPLIHLLRNAIDHGIESPQQRKAAGKPETGKLIITVRAEGSRISMIIEDDGAGIDTNLIREIARKRNIATASELAAMKEEEIMEMIFRPGFSSKEIITSVSGRGVGLDVVRTNLTKIKGSVRIHSTPGKGTRFILWLPLTLATDHGLMTRSNGHTYAIPSTSVDRVMELLPEDIVEVEACHAILLDGKAVPLHSLASVLEMNERDMQPEQAIPVVLVSNGWDTVALAVDEILGEREMVIKPLQSPLLSVRNIIGCTLTGEGEIVMVLNPGDLVASAHRSGARLHLQGVEGESMPDETTVPRIMVVDDSITTRTLEKNILETAGYRVVTSVDGQQAWEMLQDEEVDLVVTDIQMPKMDGFELTERIKQDERLAELPVVIVTSLASEVDRQRGIEVGANAYIVKGEFETRTLLDVVRQIV